jgi:hypothetical protein
MTAFETQVWSLVAGEVTLPSFEQWLYQHLEVEAEVGSGFFLRLLSADFRDMGAIAEILGGWMRQRYREPNRTLITEFLAGLDDDPFA